MSEKTNKTAASKTAPSNEKPQMRGSLSARGNDITDMLVKGEEIVAQGQIHAGIYWQSAVVLVFAVFLALFVIFELGALLAVVAVLMFAYNAIRQSILMLVITNKRVLVRYGILQIDVVDMRFDKIESLELERMIPGYLMGYANVVIMGTGQRFVSIPYVGNAREIRQIYNQITLADDEKEAL